MLLFPLPFISGIHAQQPSLCSDHILYSNYIHIHTNSNLTSHEFTYHNLSSYLLNVSKQEYHAHHNYEIKVPLKDFEYENETIYRDFLELLCADKYPFVSIIIKKDQLFKLLTAGTSYSPTIIISMAGNASTYVIPCDVFDLSKHLVYIRGHKIIRLTEFNLNPPVKFGGLVKVKNEVNIDFGFVVHL